MKVDLSQQEIGLLLGAMIEKRMETDRYLKGWDAPVVPEERHSCCDTHRQRWERDREMVVNLTHRQEAEAALIKRLEAWEER